MTPMPPKTRIWLALGVLFLCHTAFWVNLRHLHFSDPDTFIYLGMAREAAQSGIITTLAQVEDLGWAKKFADKNLAFNLINGAFYRAAGDAGVEFSLFLMSLAVVFALFIGVVRFLSPFWATLVVSMTYLNANFAIRLFLLRPHVWAIFCFVGLLAALIHRAPTAALIFGALFGWGYPLYPLPIALLLVAALFFNFRRVNPLMKKACQWGLAGVALSMILHPAFPANLNWTSKISQIAVNGMSLSTQELPIENVPQRSDEFLKRFFLFFLMLLGSISFEAFYQRKWQSEEKRLEYYFLSFISLGLWTVAFFQPRAAEYAIPCTVIFMALSLSRLSEFTEPRRLATAFVTVCVLGNIYSLIDFYGKGARFSLNPRVPLAVMAALPKDAKGKKVFNCEWETGAFLFYRRPEMRFVDILDPTFLPKANPTLAAQRQLLFEGKLLPYNVIRGQFSADYVVCRNPSLTERLDRDPFFVRLFPPPPDPIRQEVAGYSAVYAVNDKMMRHFVKSIATSTEKNKPETNVSRDLSSPPNLTPDPQSMPYWNLIALATKHIPDEATACFEMTLPSEELDKFKGSEWLGIGGGPLVEVWWNQTPLFKSVDNNGDVDYLRDLVALPQALKTSDKLVFKVCSRREDSYHGAAISFWMANEMAAVCAQKGYPEPARDAIKWRFGMPKKPHCLGRIALAK